MNKKWIHKFYSNFFTNFVEIIGWLQIAISPFIIGLLAGVLVYVPEPTTIRLIVAISITLIGLVTGILWATRVKKKMGTINFLSRISATPELDKQDEDDESKIK